MPSDLMAGAAITAVGLALSVVLVWGLGFALVYLLASPIEEGFIGKAVASLLVGVVLCGFVVMLPAHLAPSQSSFRVIIHWFVPVLAAILVPLAMVRWARSGGHSGRRMPARSGHWRDWTSALALAAFVIAALAHHPQSLPSIELAAAQDGIIVHVDVTFRGSGGEAYVLVGGAPPDLESTRYDFSAPESGVVTFAVPFQKNMSVDLRTPAGVVLRSLHLP